MQSSNEIAKPEARRGMEGGSAPQTLTQQLMDQIDPARLPRHVAFIMDGNGRWAKARKLPRVEGHRAGIRAVRETIETCAQLGIEVITMYAFSTENWKRPRLEVATLMSLLKEYLNRELKTFLKNNLRFTTIGRIDRLDRSVQRELEKAVRKTTDCTGMIVQIALNYSGRQELTDLVRDAVSRAVAGQLSPDEIDESWVNDQLCQDLPAPDLMVRTSGEQRISNFLLWQIAYSEIYFCPVLWPDFTREELLRSLLEYQKRERRFGGLPAEQDVFTPAGGRHEA